MTTLTTRRLVLRPLHNSDAEAITMQIGDYDVCKNLARVPYPYHVADAEDFLGWVKGFDQRSLFAAITERDGDGLLIGIISSEFAPDKDDSELGYWLAKPYWNRGYMKEAAAAMVDHAFMATPLALMVSCYHNDNPNSGKILRGVGFEDAGACTSFSKAQGKDVDITNLRLSRERWLAMKKAA
jgi:RimJ/RimL family protein N-acetyltransferase